MSNESYEEVKESRNFTGKVVLVTGSSSGIGEGTVKLYSILGAKVVVTGRNETRIKAVAEECHKLSPHGLKVVNVILLYNFYNLNLKPLEVVADLTKQDDAKRLVDSTIKEYGKLDILVNNAGSSVLSSIKDDKVLEEFDKVFNIDVRSVVEMIHLSIPHLEKSKGTIINISSDAGLSPVF
jgi:NAD(P)-dependent dehydrogenase (short-subunit alcohol dehydrogenase family)